MILCLSPFFFSFLFCLLSFSNSRTLTEPLDHPRLSQALERFRMAVTNYTPEAELQAAHTALDGALREVEIEELVTSILGRHMSPMADTSLAAASRAFEEALHKHMQEVVSGLYCGSYAPASDLDTLRNEGITHIVCCIPVEPHFPDEFEVRNFCPGGVL